MNDKHNLTELLFAEDIKGQPEILTDERITEIDLKMLVAQGPQNLISATEREKRLEAAIFAKANLELEKETITPVVIFESVRFINGEITLDEFSCFVDKLSPKNEV